MFGRKRIKELEAKVDLLTDQRQQQSFEIYDLKQEIAKRQYAPGPFVELLKELGMTPCVGLFGTAEQAARAKVYMAVKDQQEVASNVAELYRLMKVGNFNDAKTKVMGWRGAEATVEIFAKAVASCK